MFLSISDQSNIESENELRLRGLKKCVEHLKKKGLGVQMLEDVMVDSIVDTKLLWILWPERWFMPPEITSVRSKVEGGMGLLVTSEWSGIEYNAEILNTLVEDFGIKFNKDRIIDPINAYTENEIKSPGDAKSLGGLGGKLVEFIKIKDFGMHPAVDGLKELAYYSGCSLTAATENILARSKFVSFSDLNADKKWSEGEKIGSAIIAAYSEHKSGRIIAVGDTSLFTDKYLSFRDNEQFLLNTLRWLLKEI